MRCKNCGTYNDDNRYICETCGSPLYDEESIESISPANEKTQTFNAVTNPVADEVPYQPNEPVSHKPEGPKDNSEKKSIIVIAILVVVLIAVIASVAVVAHSKSKAKDETTTDISTTLESTERTTQPTTQQTTERTTTTTTTTTTTKPTTTEAQTWYINVSSSGGGAVSGAGQFTNGSKVTITADADDGYEFYGWYSDGVKVSDKEKYSFTANENKSFSAVFNPVEAADNNTIENMNDMD